MSEPTGDPRVPCSYEVVIPGGEDENCGKPSVFWSDNLHEKGLCVKHAKVLYGQYPQHRLDKIDSVE